MQTETPNPLSPARTHRTIFLLLLLTVAFFATALVLLLYYWDLLVGFYQTIFLICGFLPTLVAFFAVLYLWAKQNRQDAIRRFMQEEEAKNKQDKSSAP